MKGIKNREKPEFRVDLIDKKVSIELTQLINSRQKKIEAFRKKIIKDAEQKFISKFGSSFRVWVTFSNYQMNTKEHDLAYFVDLIFNTVSNIYTSNKGREFTVKTKRNSRENKYIDSIHVTTQISPAWESAGEFLVDYVDIEWIQSIITRKASLITDYDAFFDENWLVMKAGIGNKSSGYRFDHIAEKLKKEKFDRVFIFESFPNELMEI
ncbi:MAG: hypothetical protein ACSHW7_02300 [Patiriisocius sp.]|uniref:hypothetical protein n=1 Tax=Patiriisocius sp. TaxID=2822396 RepID=UPI003EF65B75